MRIDALCALVFVSLLVGGCANGRISSADRGVADCQYDEESLMALPEKEFDWGPRGWRSIGGKAEEKCPLVAAAVIQRYRERSQSSLYTLPFHIAQLKAFSGDYANAISFLKQSFRPKNIDPAWNHYVSATIAFLSRDRAKLDDELDFFKREQEENGSAYTEMTLPDGKKVRVPYPLNADVVEGLSSCFSKTYSEAYAGKCRPSR